MIKKERRNNEDKYYKLETKRNKTQGKKKKPIEESIEEEIQIPFGEMSATELAEYYDELE